MFQTSWGYVTPIKEIIDLSHEVGAVVGRRMLAQAAPHLENRCQRHLDL